MGDLFLYLVVVVGGVWLIADRLRAIHEEVAGVRHDIQKGFKELQETLYERENG